MSMEPNPYGNFRFRVTHGGRPVAAFNVSCPSDDRRALTLERGICEDFAFERRLAGSREAGAAGQAIDLEVEVRGDSGEVTATWCLRGCRVTRYLAMPYMDGTRRVAIRALDLACTDWEALR